MAQESRSPVGRQPGSQPYGATGSLAAGHPARRGGQVEGKDTCTIR
ncbi:MAG: hypothetical protein ACP5VP_08565 [Candidatus Limnocylindrales bacterium]